MSMVQPASTGGWIRGIRTDMGTQHSRSEMAVVCVCVCVGRFVRHQPVKVTCNRCICVDMFELYDSPLTLKSFVYFTVQLYCINSFLMKQLIELVRLSAVIQSLWHLNLGFVWHAVFIYMKRWHNHFNSFTFWFLFCAERSRSLLCSSVFVK
jgi:hypothetical protein